MKYGEQLEKESVPGWSLHNIDYNSLKHHIKVYTTKGQATAIAIPGHQDLALSRFEDELYLELRRQHDRVDLFISSKADELTRRLDHLANQVARVTRQSPTLTSAKLRRRLAKCERDLAGCNDDIRALSRFAAAQVVAFRKILKKYRKWTGSVALGSRFRENVLAGDRSFSHRDFTNLQARHDEIFEALQAAIPADLDQHDAVRPTLLSNADSSDATLIGDTITAGARNRDRDRDLEAAGAHFPGAPAGGYWNEYDYGSEAGDGDFGGDGGYAIYIDPDQDDGFPGMATLVALIRVPVEKARAWLAHRKGSRSASNSSGGGSDDGVHAPLLAGRHGGRGDGSGHYGATTGQHAATAAGLLTDTDAEGDGDESYISSGAATPRHASGGMFPHSPHDNKRHIPSTTTSSTASSSSSLLFPPGYATHYASTFPSVSDQHLTIYRARVVFWSTMALFAGSAILLGVSAVLLATGRHKLHGEVVAGAAVGAVASLACACMAVGMNLTRNGTQFSRSAFLRGGVGYSSGSQSDHRRKRLHALVVWLSFAALCVLNGGLLVIVARRL